MAHWFHWNNVEVTHVHFTWNIHTISKLLLLQSPSGNLMALSMTTFWKLHRKSHIDSKVLRIKKIPMLRKNTWISGRFNTNILCHHSPLVSLCFSYIIWQMHHFVHLGNRHVRSRVTGTYLTRTWEQKTSNNWCVQCNWSNAVYTLLKKRNKN